MATIIGTTGDDTIAGFGISDGVTGGPPSAADDSISGLSGNDDIDGEGGADTILGGGGDDSIHADDDFTGLLDGGAGTDRLRLTTDDWFYSAGADVDLAATRFEVVQSDWGNDTLDGSRATGPVTIDGNGGSDVIRGSAFGDDLGVSVGIPYTALPGHATIDGGAGDDTIVSQYAGRNSIDGGDGDDVIDARYGRNTILGGDGADEVNGGEDSDEILGGSGADTLTDIAGADSVDGGTGRDLLSGGLGADTLRGGGAADIVRFEVVECSPADTPDAVAGFHGAGRPGGDVVDLSAMDADAGRAGEQAFTFLGASGAFTASGQVRLVDIGAQTLLLANTDIDPAAAEFAVVILDGDAADASDYVALDFVL